MKKSGIKKYLITLLLGVIALSSFAQKETYDLVTYMPPAGWKKEVKENVTAYSIINKKNNSWCQVQIIKSTNSKGTIEQDFDSEWQDLVVKIYKPTESPQLNEVLEADGWKIKAGGSKFVFNGSDAMVFLTTASGFNRCVSIVASTNTQDYLKDIQELLSSVDLVKPEMNTQQPAGNNGNRSVVGTWGIGTTTASYYNTSINEGSIIIQYTFNANGTYSFYIKTFRYLLDKLLLTKETGTYQVSGNNITISPQKSVIESWSKKNNADDWGKLISSQKRELEKITYQFLTEDFGSGMVLVLKASKETKRDGYFNNSSKDAWFYPAKSSVEFIKLPAGEQIATEATSNIPAKETVSDNNTPILGTWGKSSSVHETYGDQVSHGNAGYSTGQYTFNANGIYSFVAKTFRMSYDKILLVKENGTYNVSGTSITIIPQKSIIEAWSKKDGTDKWGKLLSSQNRSLEKVTYKFAKHYFSGIQQWNFVLQADKATERDGPFSNNTTFSNAWYYAPISSTNPVIQLPEAQQQTAGPAKQEPAVSNTTSGFAFNITNFDDGWVSTVQEDWAEVTKGTTRVLIHYPNKKADAYNSVVLDGLKTAWNVLVEPKYSNVLNVEFRPISNWQTIEFAEADAVEKITAKTVHVVLFKMNYSNGSGKYLEFITPDKNSFEQQFGAYHQSSSGWEKMETMANYNKFAIAVTDLKGKWSSDYSGAIQYVNAATGRDAGMDTHASAENFEFNPGNTYKWDLAVASGAVGNIKFQSVKSSGKFSMPGNWQISFSDIEGKPRTYNVYFSCIKGFRILWINGKAFFRI